MRVGFTVTKKIGGAVVRNRMKRRFRALAREIVPAKGIAGADHVMIGRAKGIERDFALLRSRARRRARQAAQAVIARLHDPGRTRVAEGPLANPSAELPLSAELLGLCDYRNRALWRGTRGLDGAEAHLPLPPWGGQGPDPVPERIESK